MGVGDENVFPLIMAEQEPNIVRVPLPKLFPVMLIEPKPTSTPPISNEFPMIFAMEESLLAKRPAPVNVELLIVCAARPRTSMLELRNVQL
jgi:hypothetical protein